jgi:preprotein translocase subunit SecA
MKKELSGLAGEDKLNKAKARTSIIEYLSNKARENYEAIKINAKNKGIDWRDIEKNILIRSIDTLWIEHLNAISSLRQGIGLRGYGQRDPLIEYKREAYGLYNELNSLIQKEVVYGIFKLIPSSGQHHIGVEGIKAPDLSEKAANFSAPAKEMSDKLSSFATMAGAGAQMASGVVREKVKNEEGEKVGRNDFCPCGSGKKYKKCCGK